MYMYMPMLVLIEELPDLPSEVWDVNDSEYINWTKLLQVYVVNDNVSLGKRYRAIFHSECLSKAILKMYRRKRSIFSKVVCNFYSSFKCSNF